MKKTIPAEAFYIMAILTIGAAIALMQKADLGLSTVIAPSEALCRALIGVWPGATLGVVSYLVQGLLLVVMCLVIRNFRVTYLFSFVTAVIMGYSINAFIALLAPLPADTMWLRILYFCLGMPLTSLGISFVLHTYFAPEVYELILKEVPRRFGIGIGKFKTGFDIFCVTAALIISFTAFGFGRFEGVGVGTAVAALVNGTLISKFCGIIDRHVGVRDILPLRKFFEEGGR